MSSKYIYTSYKKKLTSTEEFDTENFILEVQKRECIWNVNSKSYYSKCISNREAKKRAWEEIARVFHPNWESYAVEDRQKKVEGLSKKWANIRKYYADEVRKPANSPPKKRLRRYHHLLTFLDDSIQKKRISRAKESKNIGEEELNNDSSSDSEVGELYIVEDLDELKQLSPECTDPPVFPIQLNNKNGHPDSYLETKREPKEKKFNLWEAALLPPVHGNSNTEIVRKNPEIMKLLKESRGPPRIHNNFMYIPSSGSADDSLLSKSLKIDQTAEGSKKFLLSLLPEVMSLNVKQTLQFRLGIMDLLNDIKLNENSAANPKLFPDIQLNKILNND